jgi:monoamine oxidase
MFHRRWYWTKMVYLVAGKKTPDYFGLNCLYGGRLARKESYDTEEILEQEWAKKPWSQGAPSPVMGPGLFNKYADVLRAPCSSLHFVGTETAYEWKGYINSAISARERGVQEVIQALRKSAGSNC